MVMSTVLCPSSSFALARCSVDGIEAGAVDSDAATARLTAAIACGDACAIEAFYRHYFDFLYQQARQITRRDESFCLDVVQEAVLRVVRSVRKAESNRQFSAWLRLVIKTCAFDLLKTEARRRSREQAASMAARQAHWDRDTKENDDIADRIAWLRSQLESFDPKLVRMIELRFYRSWRLAEIGRKVGLSAGAVDGRLRRALKLLQTAAKDDFDE